MQASDLAALRGTVRAFCDAEVRPTARQRDRDEQFPADLLGGLAEVGVLAATIPEPYGGAGLDAAAYRVVIEELGAADSSLRSLVSVHLGLVAGAVQRWGTEAQQQRWLPVLATGGLGAFGLTEPDAGSDPASMVATAGRRDGGWVLHGTKVFITNGSRGALTLVFARAVVDGQDRGITCFLVPQDADGYRARSIHGKLGLRSGDTAEVALEGVAVGPEAVLGEVGQGMKIALSALDDGRFSLAAGAVGLAREALEVSLRYASERRQWGGPIAGKQLVQELLAATHVDVQAATGLVDVVVARKLAQERCTLEVATAKLFATEASVRCADRAVQVHGGYGYVDEYPVQRLLRDARVTTLYEGTSQIQHLLIGRLLTGLDAF